MIINRKKILVINDERNIVDIVKSYLERSDYSVYPAYNGQQAFDMIDRIAPSLIVLDLILPDIAGEEICTAIRKKSRFRLLF